MTTQRLTMAQALIKYLDPPTRRPRRTSKTPSSPASGASSAMVMSRVSVKPWNSTPLICATIRAATNKPRSSPPLPTPNTKNRLATFACASSIGPGATNMITGAAVATVNRIPVLLLPGDIFAERIQAPVLQQLESEHSSGHQRQRLLQTGLALLGSHLPSRTIDHRAAGSDARTSPHRPIPAPSPWHLPQDVQAEALRLPEFHVRETSLEYPAQSTR